MPRLSELLGGGLASSQTQAIESPMGIPAGVGRQLTPDRRTVLAGGGAAAVGALVPSSLMTPRISDGRDAGALAIDLLRESEGYRGEPVLFAYDDTVFPPQKIEPGDPVRGTLTIGWGRAYGVEPGDEITEARADAMLMDDLREHMEAVWSLEADCRRRGHPSFTEEQRAALCSFSYNVGASGMLSARSVAGRMRAGDYRGAGNGLLLYVKQRQGGRLVEVGGLVARRERERALFMSGPPPDTEIAMGERATPANPEKPLAQSSTVGASVLGAIGIAGGYVQSVTGIAPSLQGWILLGGVAMGLGGLVWALVERIRKHRTAEGW